VFLAAASAILAQTPATPTGGGCRLRATVSGSTVSIDCREGADARFVQILNDFLTANPAAAPLVNAVLDRTPELASGPDTPTREQVVRQWIAGFEEAGRRLAELDTPWARKAAEAVRRADLAAASSALGEAIAGLGPEAAAPAQFPRGLLTELQAQDPQAYYDAAYRSRPDDRELAFRYGDCLRRQGELRLAGSIYEVAIEPLRESVRNAPEGGNPAEAERLAAALKTLSLIYRGQDRLPDAERTLEESLALLIVLAKGNPSRYLRDAALTTLSVAQTKLAQGSAGLREACQLARQLRQMGMSEFPVWAADVERACPAQ
jgi:tetratricopeptide (TPR) repeat protein